jgi:DNA-binding MarR family transcriptional regulator
MKKTELSMTDMYAQPGYLIRRAHQTATAAFSAATADLDLTPVQFSALLAIKDKPDIDATRVSEMISFDRTTIGHVLARLERKKLIARRDGVADKRTKLIRLTLKGEAVIRDVSLRVEKIAESILKPLSISERTTLLKLLTKFATSTGDQAGEYGAPAPRKRRQAEEG